MTAVRRLVVVLVPAAAVLATWLAWIAHGVLCEEGCAGRPWPLVAQLVAACAGLPLAIAATHMVVLRADRRARPLLVAVALAYAGWAILLMAALVR